MTTLAQQVGGNSRVIGGPFGSKLTQKDYHSEGIPVIRGSNMEHNGRWIGGDFARVTSRKVARDLSANLAHRGDIIVTQRGTLGQVSIIPSDGDFDTYVISQSQMAISVLPGTADPMFVYYYLRSPAFAEYIRRITIQTGVPHINLGLLRDTPVRWPPLQIQQTVGSALSKLDDKIELNRRINETLEGMAQAIFRDWFVDFGPIRRKLEGATDPVTIMGGVVQDLGSAERLATAFPEELNSEGVPLGYVPFELRQLANHHTASVSPMSSPDEMFSHYSLPAFDAGRNPKLDRGDAILSNKTLLPPGAILLSKLNPEIPRVWLAEINNEEKQICSTEFLVFTPKHGSGRALLYGIFLSPAFRSLLVGMVTGTSKSHQRVAPKALLGTEVGKFGLAAMAAYEATARPLMELVQHNLRQTRMLAATRDLLLPKLMSGQIRLRQAEEMLEAAQ